MQRAQLGPPMVHLAKFDQNRLKDLGARRVDDRHTHRQTHTQTDRHTDRQTNAGNNKGNPSDRANNAHVLIALKGVTSLPRQKCYSWNFHEPAGQWYSHILKLVTDPTTVVCRELLQERNAIFAWVELAYWLG